MRYWLDTEFAERPCTIDLISVGIVAEDGREFYAESNEVDWERASPWVLENVYPHLGLGASQGTTLHESRVMIGKRLREWNGDDERPEFWGYYSDYDWVVFCWLQGKMDDLPPGWPMFCRDVKQWCIDLGNPPLPEQTSTEHNAIADARWTRDAWRFLDAYQVALREHHVTTDVVGLLPEPDLPCDFCVDMARARLARDAG